MYTFERGNPCQYCQFSPSSVKLMSTLSVFALFWKAHVNTVSFFPLLKSSCQYCQFLPSSEKLMSILSVFALFWKAHVNIVSFCPHLKSSCQYCHFFCPLLKSSCQYCQFLPSSEKRSALIYRKWKGIYSKRKEFPPPGSKFFPFKADPFSEGGVQGGKQKVTKVISLFTDGRKSIRYILSP